MRKQTSTKSVFHQLAELDDPAGPVDLAEPDDRDDPDSTSPAVAAAADADAADDAEATEDVADADDAQACEADGAEETEETDGADKAEEADQTGETAGTKPPGRRRRRVVAVMVGALLVAALGCAGYLGWRVKQIDETTAAGQAAMEAARNYAVILTTLDSKDIDKNYRQALDGATGEFKDQYSQGSAQLRQILIDNGAAGKGIVVDSAIKSATKTKVEVLLFVDQSVTNAVRPSPRIDRNRVMMTMQLVDGRWLASKVEII
ncbi:MULTISPECIES: Mce protein [Mycobacterium]|uniref:Mce protein n=1 Tax=Mycobacterium kiyosense TaxID=2871094 RepID=A0A9P3Q7M4_9MYCO|nr:MULTISPECIES: Mce protein [Mycobacterium]BDE16175.1 hypothetical protein MKCMC460_50350 [Mycobacterium sp. 20KCMC460]GLB82154.1 hypothetical protein SRL2020028_14100 [Mycobacterium kiyosense]GLB90555.1 hypothetical protein SRL2020130_33720 [Mycobacterium kiyosense]GLB95296.1 hypothetical protein SRL2020226_20720 [Mycobacterium kiyosense]GLC00231.1 hypothetical protein SRL2020400_08220 [Mycobacterium kiyosense]